VAATPFSSGARDVIAALLAIARGIQNSVARRLAVPDMTTTVLTMTLTGVAADLRTASYRPSVLRRLVSVAVMLGGAILGAWLTLHINAAITLGIAAGIVAVVAVGIAATGRRAADWRQIAP
jgi:uncharacterized membrane protein YoaK (UPF0700 family)